jgi:hypothetical protein
VDAAPRSFSGRRRRRLRRGHLRVAPALHASYRPPGNPTGDDVAGNSAAATIRTQLTLVPRRGATPITAGTAATPRPTDHRHLTQPPRRTHARRESPGGSSVRSTRSHLRPVSAPRPHHRPAGPPQPVPPHPGRGVAPGNRWGHSRGLIMGFGVIAAIALVCLARPTWVHTALSSRPATSAVTSPAHGLNIPPTIALGLPEVDPQTAQPGPPETPLTTEPTGRPPSPSPSPPVSTSPATGPPVEAAPTNRAQPAPTPPARAHTSPGASRPFASAPAKRASGSANSAPDRAGAAAPTAGATTPPAGKQPDDAPSVPSGAAVSPAKVPGASASPPLATTPVPQQPNSATLNGPTSMYSTDTSDDSAASSSAPSWLTEDQIRRYTGSRSVARESQTPAGQQILTELFGATPPSSR